MVEGLLFTIAAAVLAAAAFAGGYYYQQIVSRNRIRSATEEARRIISEAQAKQKETLLEAKEEVLKHKASVETELRERRSDIQRSERRLQQKEETLDRKAEGIERRERSLVQKERELEEARTETESLRKKQQTELHRISGLTPERARELLLKSVEDEIRQDAAHLVRRIEQEAREEAEAKARRVITTAIQRYAGEQATENATSVITLPNDDMKGRIIGREGRNIRALESLTGVDLIIDDTPDAVMLSCFDPMRREVARMALTKLIYDGRIHPARIEEEVQKAKQEMDRIVKEAGEKAAYEAGVPGLHPELLKTLGQLKFRTSYGQNVLIHSVEVANLAAMMAAEIGADVKVTRMAGLLHDIGKALDHAVEGSHAQIGAELAGRFGIPQKVIDGIEGHHPEQVEEQTLEAVLIQAADAISGARPGARRETVESYLKRMENLETVAKSFEGVEKSFAIQAGREIRIFVRPDHIDDLGAVRLARDIAKKIEETLEFPGQIKVTVVRETRAVEYAK